jgi:hypothetical protein
MTPASGTWARIASVSALVRTTGRPTRNPAWGSEVERPHTKKLFVALREKSFLTPFSSPLPDPSITISMKMPQNTPNAVRNVLSLLPLSTL